jgi:hypothetical protein
MIKVVALDFLLVAGLIALAGAAAAQSQNPPANPGPNNPAINRSEGNNPGAPVAGANSFTEGQAQSRIEQNGYTNVTELKKDDTGVWRGKAHKDGRSVALAQACWHWSRARHQPPGSFILCSLVPVGTVRHAPLLRRGSSQKSVARALRGFLKLAVFSYGLLSRRLRTGNGTTSPPT